MKKYFMAPVIVMAFFLFLSGCATKKGIATGSQPGMESHKVTVSTGEAHEYCDIWEVGDTVNISYTSSEPVVFNVHYHTKHDVFYPIKDTLADKYSGSFTIQTKDVYCGMWQNNNNDYVELSFEVGVMNK